MDYLESICTADVNALKESGSVLTVFTANDGCILDDLIVTKITNDHLFVVSNAGRKEHDKQHMLQTLVINFSRERKTFYSNIYILIRFAGDVPEEQTTR